MRRWKMALAAAVALALLTGVVMAQPPGGGRRPGQRPGSPRGWMGQAPAQQPGPPGGWMGQGPGQRPGPPGGWMGQAPGQGPGFPGGWMGQGPGRGFRPAQIPLMLALDADKDGELSAEEINQAVAALKKLDKNGDGKLDREELRPQLRGPAAPGRGGPAAPARGTPARPGRGVRPLVERIMGLDKDGDGKVTKDELPEGMQRMFDRVDANQDGVIDKVEAEKAAAQRLGRGGVGPRGAGRRPQRPPRPGPSGEA